MKKINAFMSKKPVMISFIVAAVLVLALYIGILARPIAYGLKYSSTSEKDGVKTTSSYVLNVNHKAEFVEKDSLGNSSVNTAWYYQDGDYVMFGMVGAKTNTEGYVSTYASYKDFKANVEKILKDNDTTLAKIYENKLDANNMFVAKVESSAFGMTLSGNENLLGAASVKATCGATIAFAVYEAILLAVLVAGATWSIVATVKKKA